MTNFHSAFVTPEEDFDAIFSDTEGLIGNLDDLGKV